jgi:hypothetical protein
MAFKIDQFKKDSSGWNQSFDNPKGMVGRYLESQAKGVERLARTLAPKGTGALAASIRAGSVVPSSLGLEVEVTAHAPYSLMVHEGTPPHIISPNGPGVLVFPAGGGGIVFAEEVHHPGTKGQPFLSEALIMVTRHWDHVSGTP